MKALVLALPIWICAASGDASAQEPADALYVSGQLDFAEAASGGTGGVEWLRTSDRAGTDLGVLSGSRGDAWWTYGRAGGFIRRRRVMLSGTLDAGGGTHKAARFGYQRFAGGIATPLAAGRVVLEAEGQLARMASDARRILRIGIGWRLSPVLAAGASYYVVSRDRSLSPAFSTRLDLDRGRTSFLGGVVLARRETSPALLTEVGVMPLTSTEFFVGCGFRAGSYRLQVIADVVQAASAANRLLVSLRIPIGVP